MIIGFDASTGYWREWHGGTVFAYHVPSLNRYRAALQLPVPFRAGSTKAGQLHRVHCYLINGRRCATCRKPRRFYDVQLDHDHTNGLARDLVCPSCNIKIGHIEGGYKGLKVARRPEPKLLRYLDHWAKLHSTFASTEQQLNPPPSCPPDL